MYNRLFVDRSLMHVVCPLLSCMWDVHHMEPTQNTCLWTCGVTLTFYVDNESAFFEDVQVPFGH